jgi:superfamily II DNA helicase RecQ
MVGDQSHSIGREAYRRQVFTEFQSILENLIYSRFGFTPSAWQVDAIASIMTGKDVVVSAGTGSGKSLCFQGASTLLKEGEVIIIVAPLTALMDNHVRSLLDLDGSNYLIGYKA